eukprot:TRINITY_DN13962_c0_g1_i1.p1 TRINITY_DN13962_c0_g1~~TRINITY_DN13962_c0_g1_i1.p1  ORF type:complete len:437 (+),score=146.70 TRINITY_DN13962_c0_g1_i1:53-1363(+)
MPVKDKKTAAGKEEEAVAAAAVKEEAAAADDEEWREEEDDEEDGSDMEEEEEEDHTLANPDVVAVWKHAGRLANQALGDLIPKCVAGANVFALCAGSDALVQSLVDGVYKKESKRSSRQYRKALSAVGFPTCISVNTIACHNSPESDDGTTLVEGDIVRIDLGVSLLGHLATVAHTVVVGGVDALSAVLKTKAANVFAAAHTCEQAALRLLRPGNTNDMVTDAVGAICESHGVMPVEGTLSHRIEWDDVEGTAAIILRKVPSEPPQKVDTATFEAGQAWMLDIVITSGAGRLREGDRRPTVFRRTMARESMRVRASRDVLSRVSRMSGTFPFSLRQLSEVKAARFGVMECVKSNMMLPYPILFERGGEVVAHVKSTVLILPKEIVQISGGPPLALHDTAPERPLRKDVLDALKRNLMLVARKKKKPSGKKEGEKAE